LAAIYEKRPKKLSTCLPYIWDALKLSYKKLSTAGFTCDAVFVLRACMGRANWWWRRRNTMWWRKCQKLSKVHAIPQQWI